AARQGARARAGNRRSDRPLRRPRRARACPVRAVRGGARVITMSLAEIAEVTGGRVVGGDPATCVVGSVEFDSRKVTSGGLFVAFRGERVDGHDFAVAAAEAGAVAVMGTRPTDVPTVVVDDCLAAMGRLARAVVDRLPELVIVGITGSSGK